MEYQHLLNISIEILNKNALRNNISQRKSREIYDEKLTRGQLGNLLDLEKGFWSDRTKISERIQKTTKLLRKFFKKSKKQKKKNILQILM